MSQMCFCFPVRRGAISYEKTDKAAIYVRTLGDVRVHSADLATKSHKSKKKLLLSKKTTAIQREGSIERKDHPIRRMPARVRRCSSCCYSTVRKKRPDRRAAECIRNSVCDAQVDHTYPGEAKAMLDRLGRWDFDMFHLEEVTGGHSLQVVGMKLFEENRLISEFGLDRFKLWRCFTLFESGYHGHPYHNSTHAADVTQAMHCYLQESKLKDTLRPLEVLAALVAAAAHDLDHPGVNQTYLIATNHHLSKLYQNSSVLENHHWRCCISVIIKTGLLSHIPEEQWRIFFDLIQSLILATDIARQQEFLSRFQDQLNSGKLNLQNPENRKLVLQMALKCADICNPCRSWDTAKKWAECVCKEFFKQGDRERREGLSVSPSCNKYKITTAKIQQGFLKWVVEPLFTSWHSFLPTELSRHMLDMIVKHQKVWAGILNNEEMKKVSSGSSSIAAPSNEIVTVVNRLSKTTDIRVDITSRSKVEKRKMQELLPSPPSLSSSSSTTSAIRTLDVNERDGGVVLIANLSSSSSSKPRREEKQAKCNNHKDAMAKVKKKQDGLIVEKREEDIVEPSAKKGALTNHHPPRSPRPKRKEATSRDRSRPSTELFQLRLTRSPVTSRRGLTFEDPWEKQIAGSRSPYHSHNALNSVNSFATGQHPSRSPRSESKRTHSSYSRGFKAGLNNNIESYIPHMGQQYDLGLNQNMSHSTTEMLSSSPPPVGGYPARPVSYSSASHSHFNSLQSLPTHNRFGYHGHDQQPDDLLGTKAEESEDIRRGGRRKEDGEGGDGGKRTLRWDDEGSKRTLRGSPYIQRRMAERDNPKQDRHSAAGGLSPRMPTKNYSQGSAPTSPPTHLYSVPPALSPLMNDFTSSQMASIAKRKQQREDTRRSMEDR
ncbi:uncharacterized protein [Apostichopus japonicus]|uniref:uncharacterized protein isoform X3 n=1 Tax=Stichopus japonicus TaxID=307972 RepID=UPI003AB77817